MGTTSHKSKNQHTSLPPEPLPTLTGSSNIAPRAEVPTAEKQTTAASKSTVARGKKGRKPKGMTRATVWSPDVENSYRLQQSGWKSLEEYEIVHGPPTFWFVIPSAGGANSLAKIVIIHMFLV